MKTVLLSLLLVAPAALAQPPRDFFPWWDHAIARDLNLSEEQRSQIRAAVQESRDRIIDLRAAVEKAEAGLDDAMNEEPFDARRAAEASEQLVKARSELTRAFSQMSLKLRGVLKLEQWRELQRRRPKPQPPGPGVGPGPAGGPGPGPGSEPGRPARRRPPEE